MGVFIGASTKIIDRATGQIHMGRVPAYSVVVPGNPKGPTEMDALVAYLQMLGTLVDFANTSAEKLQQ